MNRIESKIKNLQKEGKKVLAGYFMAGEFGIDETLEIMHESVSSGLDVIELGFPFSDPTADGETIQQSAKTALANGTTMESVFSIVAKFRKENQTTPIILMGYFNIAFQYGLENFAKQCKECGIDGLIIVDLPIEESSPFETILQKYNVFLIQIVSFLTSKERFAEVQFRAKGFIYLVSTFGVTGKAKPMLDRIQEYTSVVKPSIPLFVGFGIDSPQTAREISQHCDGIIIGSHFIKTMRAGGIQALTKNIIEMRNAL